MKARTKLLLIEDSEEDRFNFRRTVESLNRSSSLMDIVISQAGTLEEGLVLLERERFEVVVIDLTLPDSDDLEGLKRIADRPEPLPPVIVLTGREGTDSHSLLAIKSGAQDYLIKREITPFTLGRAIAHAIERSRMAEEIDELRLQQVKNMKLATLGEMAACIGHEINNPLTIILSLAERLLRMGQDPNADSQRKEYLNKIISTTMRISKIVKGLKVYSRSDTSGGLERCRLREVVEDTLSLCTEKFRASSIELIVEEIPEVLISSRGVQISQVLLNLLNNAIDAVKEKGQGGWVKVSFAKAGESVDLFVSDSAGPISEPQRRQLFQPFFTTKQKGHGTGLGLAISRNIVNDHGGRLEFVDGAEYTMFRVNLPLAESPGRGAKAA